MSSIILPVIAITPGEPAGIGPDITLQISQQTIDAKLIIFADSQLLQQRAQQLKLNIDIKCIEDISQAKPHQPGQLQVFHVPLVADSQTGVLN